MIQLECSNCKTTLSIDDAFAGGVCRCQQCGTIQTVPKPGDTSAASGNSQKALFKRKARIESALSPYSDGLDKAADEMGSSAGLSASELANIQAARRSASPADSAAGQRVATSVATKPDPRNGKPAGGSDSPAPAQNSAPPARRSYIPTPSKSAAVPVTQPQNISSGSRAAYAGAAVALGIAVLGVVWLMLPSSKPTAETQTTRPTPVQHTLRPVLQAKTTTLPSATTPTVSVTATTAPGEAKPMPAVITLVIKSEPSTAAASGASVCGLTLEGSSVVYILDRSGCTEATFQKMTDACFQSVESLGSSRKFQIAVWNNYKDLSFPQTGLSPAAAQAIADAHNAVSETYSGSSDIAGLLTKAKAAGATDIVLISAVDLDDVNTQSIHDALVNQSIRFHGVAVGHDLSAQRLRGLTAKFSGGFKQVDLDTLN